MELKERINLEGLSLIIDLKGHKNYGENEIGLDETNRMIEELSDLTGFEFNTYLKCVEPLEKIPLINKRLEVNTHNASIIYESKKRADYSIDLIFKDSTLVQHHHGSVSESDYQREIDIDVTIKRNQRTSFSELKDLQDIIVSDKVYSCIEKLRSYKL